MRDDKFSKFKLKRLAQQENVEKLETTVNQEPPEEPEVPEQSKTPEQVLSELIDSKKRKKENNKQKGPVGFSLPKDVHEALNKVKNETDIDRSEAVSIAVKIVYKDYF